MSDTAVPIDAAMTSSGDAPDPMDAAMTGAQSGPGASQDSAPDPMDAAMTGAQTPAPKAQAPPPKAPSRADLTGMSYPQKALIAEGYSAPGKNGSIWGYGQFTDPRWLQVVKQTMPDVAQGKTDAQILAMNLR